jgi:hypothetical protein
MEVLCWPFRKNTTGGVVARRTVNTFIGTESFEGFDPLPAFAATRIWRSKKVREGCD